MKRFVLVLDGPEKNDVLRKELGSGDVLVAVDRGLEVCFALDRPPARAFVVPRSAGEKATDWAHFSGAPCDEIASTDPMGSFEQALEWALTSDGVGRVDVVNALGRHPHIDHARLLVVARYRDTGTPITVLTPTHRMFVLTAGYTVNGQAGHEFSLIPLSTEAASITIKNSRNEATHVGLATGATNLIAQKLVEKTANLTVRAGYFMAVVPRS